MLVVQRVLGWARIGAHARGWTSDEALRALWLLFEWLLPPHRLLYPGGSAGSSGKKSERATAMAGRVAEGAGEGRRRREGVARGRERKEPLLPPRMLLPLADVSKLIAGLSRRRLVRDPASATSYLLEAAVGLVEVDRSLVDVEELAVYWVDIWGGWDPASWGASVDALPQSELPPREPVRRPAAHGTERPPLRVRL